MSARLENRRSKCMPSTSASVVRTWKAPRSGTTTAASSPGATIREGGAAGSRCRIWWISARSPGRVSPDEAGLPGDLNGARLPDHRDLDLSRILQLILDAPGDVL